MSQGILPTHKTINTKTISDDDINRIKERLKSKNREGNIKYLLNGVEFTEKKLEDDQEYKELLERGIAPMGKPSTKLYYLDYKYK